MELTQARVRELFDYREDGNLVRRVRRGPSLAGDVVGCPGSHTYLSVWVDGKNYLRHRLIFLWHNGFMPEQVDHIDLNRSNNRIENLRAANRSGNGANRGRYANNKSGYKGVCWFKPARKWHAQIKLNGKVHHLGYFDDPAVAHEAYKEAANRMHGEFARPA